MEIISYHSEEFVSYMSDVIVVESSESEGSDIEATSPGRKDISSNFIKKDEV